MYVNKSLLFLFLAYFLFFLLSTACDRPGCTNTHAVFNQYHPGEDAYQEELVKVLRKHKEDLSFWFEKYVEINEDAFLQVYIQNEHVCAKGLFKVENWEGIEGIKKRKGKGYSGAELRGFNYQILADNQLLFTQLQRIID